MKTCKDCKLEKSLQDFYKGQGECKECSKARIKKNRGRNIEYYRLYDRERQIYNFKRVMLHRYSNMRLRVIGKAIRRYQVEGKELLSKDEFINWCEATKAEYDSLFNIWAAAGFPRGLTPSVDRIDNDKGYAIGNLQWLSLADNAAKDAKGSTGERDEKGKFITKK